MNLVDRVGTLDMFITMQLNTIKSVGTDPFILHLAYPERYNRVICSTELVSKCNTANIQET